MRPRLPKTWKWRHLDDVATVQTGLALGKKELIDPVERPYLRVANVQDGHFDLRNIKTVRVERSSVEKHSLQTGDVLLTEGGDFDKLGRGHIWRGEIPDCLHQNHVFAVRTDHAVLLPEYLAAITSGPWGRAYFRGCSKQSTNLASINSTQVKEMPLPLPPLNEQRQIIERLANFDDASSLLGGLIQHRRSRLRGLMQQLLTGRRRLPMFAGGVWELTPLSDFLEPKSETNSSMATDRVLSCTKLYGIIAQEERFKQRIASADASHYQVVRRTDLVFDPMLLWDASIGFVEKYDIGVVSPAYTTLQFTQAESDRRYIRWMLRSHRACHMYKVISQGTNQRRRKAPTQAFLKAEFEMPISTGERAAIADILDTAQREVELLEQLREQIQIQKRGLMQKLLTGQTRISEYEDNAREVLC